MFETIFATDIIVSMIIRLRLLRGSMSQTATVPSIGTSPTGFKNTFVAGRSITITSTLLALCSRFLCPARRSASAPESV